MRLHYKLLYTGHHYARDADSHHLFVRWVVRDSGAHREQGEREARAMLEQCSAFLRVAAAP